jgi:hypothetical protein
MSRWLTIGVLFHLLGGLTSLDAAETAKATPFEFRDVNGRSLGLFESGRRVLVYNHGLMTDPRVPKEDPRRSRSCYIHPLYGLNGEVLTDDFPRDHYHHHGVFWGWPHVEIDGREYDLWTGKGIQQQFVRWIDRRVESDAAILTVENSWFVGERKVMIEHVCLRAGRATDVARTLDIDLSWTPVDRPITLRGAEGKSYGGLSVRFAVPEGSRPTITVPGGVAKDDLLETRLAWVDLARPFAGATTPSGATLMVPPSHPDYPPTWVARHYGLQSVGYPGVKSKTFSPGQPLRLSYRLWIHKTAADPAALRNAYDTYCHETKK